MPIPVRESQHKQKLDESVTWEGADITVIERECLSAEKAVRLRIIGTAGSGGRDLPATVHP